MTDDGLDTEIRQFRDELLAAYAAHGAPRDLADRRRIAEAVRRRWVEGGPVMAETHEIELGGVRCRLHRLTGDPRLPTLVYLHGGGWTIFSLDSHDRLMREYAAAAGCAVIGVDYSLSPEARFPVALDEAEAVVAALAGAARDLALDARRIAVGGDSAGANLALGTAIRRRDAGRELAGMLLSYGAFDTVRRDSHARYGSDDYILNPEEMDAYWAEYLTADTRDHPLARPLNADLAGLPPAFLCIAECDVLADENLAMRDRLTAAGVPVEAVVYRGATHSFLEAARVSALARRAIADAGAWLAARFAA
jgi:acetyl esterase